MSAREDYGKMPGGAVGGIPAREKSKTEPIKLLRDKDRKSTSESVAQCGCSL